MRSGRLLAEESPQVLLSMYGCQSLEEVFLKLSRKQGQLKKPVDNTENNISTAHLNWDRKNDSIYVTEESGVVGLNFHQSKEVLINDGSNGHLDVIIFILHSILCYLCNQMTNIVVKITSL